MLEGEKQPLITRRTLQPELQAAFVSLLARAQRRVIPGPGVATSMGFPRQIQLLLWKNWTLRKRQKVRWSWVEGVGFEEKEGRRGRELVAL